MLMESIECSTNANSLPVAEHSSDYSVLIRKLRWVVIADNNNNIITNLRSKETIIIGYF